MSSLRRSRFSALFLRLGRLPWTRVVVVIGLIVFAYWLGGALTTPREGATAPRPESAAEQSATWTCSMHPQIQLPKPGDCPICGMDLIPLEEGGDQGRAEGLVLSKRARALAAVRTTAVQRRFIDRVTRLNGKVVYDETRVKAVTAWIPGRLDRLFVDYTGTRVLEGDHMVLLYSPELLEAQQSLIEARKGLEETADERSAFLRSSARRHLESEREKLRLWGLEEEQIEKIEKRGEVESHIQINAPLSGIVIEKHKVEGMYVETGSPIYTVADLSKVWIELDVYEMDFPWVAYGQRVEIETEARPGEVFEGWISFVPPYLNPRTHTKKVRIAVPNPEGALKPGMFVRARLRSRLASGGRVLGPELEGLHVCPMHQEIVAEDPEDCTVCGMALVPAASLGLTRETEDLAPPLVVPATAVLRTGERGVVYVERAEEEAPIYEGREVVLGPRAGDFYIVLGGLEEGELVVTHGNFKIDSALQILARKSMMSRPGGGERRDPEIPDGFVARLAPVYAAYFEAHAALADDDLAAARAALGRLRDVTAAIPSTFERRRLHESWTDLAARLRAAGAQAGTLTGLATARQRFRVASEAILTLEEVFGHPGAASHRVAYCPMAFDDMGASWLQRAESIENPYFGASMYRCGEIRETRAGREGPDPDPRDTAPEATIGLEGFRDRLDVVYEAYFALHAALAGDELGAAREALVTLGERATGIGEVPPEGSAWVEAAGVLEEAARHAAHHEDLESLRSAFVEVAEAVLDLERRYGHSGKAVFHEMFCPMARDGNGAAWLQQGQQVENPYFGSEMPRCGELRARHAGEGR